MDAKERIIMNEACSLIIRMDRRIKFVGMVDHNGKLLIGQSRRFLPSNMIDKSTDNAKSSIHIRNSKIDDLVEVFFRSKNMYLFYSDYLLWVLGNCIVHLQDQEDEFNSPSIAETISDNVLPYFEISGGNKNSVRLAVTPVNLNADTFLCIYFEPPYSIGNSANKSEEAFKGLLNRINANIL